MDRSAHRTATRPPAAVRRSFLLWLVAVGAGVVETAIVIAVSDPSPALLVGVLLRTAVFAGVVLLAVQLLHGRRWARTTLALVPGLLGTLSLVGAPL
jgi:hypothetical protein